MSDPKHIPVVPLHRFLKHSLDILKNPLPFHHRNFQQKGDTFQLNIGFRDHVVFSRDAGFLQYVLQKNQRNYTKSPIQTVEVAKYIGKGLLTSEGALWQQQRKLIQPAFHKKQLKLLLDKIHAAIVVEIEKIETNTPYDIFPLFNDLAFQTVAKALFSGAISEEQIDRLQEITENGQKMLVRELRQPYLKWYFKLSGKLAAAIDYSKEGRKIVQQLISDRRNSDQPQDDILDMLLEARYEDGSTMDDEQLIDEILILFTAGHETTSNALSFTSQLIAQHPEVQSKIVEETTQARAKAQGDWMLFLKEATYTKCVLEESMRMYPPAYFIDRINYEDDEYNSLIIPKETNLLFSVIEIHNDIRFWGDPEQFRPERFLQASANEFSAHYFPFGAGPRMCIGNNFAMYEMIMAVTTLLERYEIQTKSTPIEITPLITLKPKNAFLTFCNRN
ncbi:MAG: cytochrome P450 [Flavobacteriaceae bacterium]|nr:cytochrome P450 [Flavobacteriaceae bacterium]